MLEQAPLEDEKKSSTWFSQLAWVGVKCSVHAAVLVRDFLDLGGHVGGEVF